MIRTVGRRDLEIDVDSAGVLATLFPGPGLGEEVSVAPEIKNDGKFTMMAMLCCLWMVMQTKAF